MGMQFMAGYVEFVLDPDSECVKDNHVTSIDAYTSALTFHSDFLNIFTGPKEINQCQLKICTIITNSLIPAENVQFSNKMGCPDG